MGTKKASQSRSSATSGFPRTRESSRRRLFAPLAQVCGGTDIGVERERNEDTFHVSDDGSLLVAADGLGGHAAGDVASEIATQFVAEFLTAESATAKGTDPDRISSLMVAAIHGAHEAILEEAKCDSKKEGMGTTLIVAAFCDGIAYLGHVGDVRGYLFSQGELTQVTDDHSPVGELVASGVITPTAARKHPDKHLISQALGLDPGVQPELNEIDLESGDMVLLCSDGLVDTLTDAEIKRTLAQGSEAYETVDALLDRANDAEAGDNVTAVVFQVP